MIVRRVALVTCDEYPQLTADDRLLLPALTAHAMTPEIVVWNDPNIDWRVFDGVVIRSTWDYYRRADEFRNWLSLIASNDVLLLNPVATVQGNMDKTYLRELAARGISTVPTAWIEPAHRDQVLAQLRAVPWDAELVIKPSVSAGAFRTVRTSKEALLRDPAPLFEILTESVALVQPFLPEIEQDGEWSFLFFGGIFSHAVIKRPKSGDFRVQWVHGGGHSLAQTSADVQAATIARQVAGDGLLYARVDGVVRDGTFLLLEIELIEPFLFLAEDPLAADRFVKALRVLL